MNVYMSSFKHNIIELLRIYTKYKRGFFIIEKKRYCCHGYAIIYERSTSIIQNCSIFSNNRLRVDGKSKHRVKP